MRRAVLAALAAASLLAAAPAAGRADEAIEKQALVLVRVLAYDRQVARRAGRSVVIGVVRADGDLGSRRASSAMASALRAASRGLTLAGKPISVVEIAAGDLLADRLRELEVTAVYLGPGLEGDIDRVIADARARPCLTFSDSSAYLHRGLAVALGTDQRRNRITIAVDLLAAREQGAALAAELLRVAEVVRR